MKSVHSFHVETAQEIGVEKAILLQHIAYWVGFNERAKKNFRDGRTWMYQSLEQMACHFPYWNKDKIFRMLKQLVKDGYLVKGNFNKSAYDRTAWYAISDAKCISQKCEMDGAKSQNGNWESATPIPDTKTEPKEEEEEEGGAPPRPPVSLFRTLKNINNALIDKIVAVVGSDPRMLQRFVENVLAFKGRSSDVHGVHTVLKQWDSEAEKRACRTAGAAPPPSEIESRQRQAWGLGQRFHGRVWAGTEYVCVLIAGVKQKLRYDAWDWDYMWPRLREGVQA